MVDPQSPVLSEPSGATSTAILFPVCEVANQPWCGLLFFVLLQVRVAVSGDNNHVVLVPFVYCRFARFRHALFVRADLSFPRGNASAVSLVSGRLT